LWFEVFSKKSFREHEPWIRFYRLYNRSWSNWNKIILQTKYFSLNKLIFNDLGREDPNTLFFPIHFSHSYAGLLDSNCVVCTFSSIYLLPLLFLICLYIRLDDTWFDRVWFMSPNKLYFFKISFNTFNLYLVSR
jgi:hypothetical protein